MPLVIHHIYLYLSLQISLYLGSLDGHSTGLTGTLATGICSHQHSTLVSLTATHSEHPGPLLPVLLGLVGCLCLYARLYAVLIPSPDSCCFSAYSSFPFFHLTVTSSAFAFRQHLVSILSKIYSQAPIYLQASTINFMSFQFSDPSSRTDIVMAMQPEHNASLFQPLMGTPSRKRRRDESFGDIEFPGAAWVQDAPSAVAPSTISRPFGQVHTTSKFRTPPPTSTIRFKKTPRMSCNHGINHPAPTHKRAKPSSATTTSPNDSLMSTGGRSRSPSPSYSYSQEMHLSPEFAPATLPMKLASNPLKPPPVQGQRCHVCSRGSLITFSASNIVNCEHCDNATCGICARECTSCDETICSRCCKEKGDYTFCITCCNIMEKEKAKKS